ncbi:hypothetical protein LXL04_038316 [Taraxacum kok-saghyz]
MGICASSQFTKNQGRPLITNGNVSPSTVKVMNSLDGKLQEFRQPITAEEVLSGHPKTLFLCSSENMFVNRHVPHVPGDEELYPGQIYFLMPISKSNIPISLEDLCVLAVQASSVFEMEKETRANDKTASSGGRRKGTRNARLNDRATTRRR